MAFLPHKAFGTTPVLLPAIRSVRRRSNAGVNEAIAAGVSRSRACTKPSSDARLAAGPLRPLRNSLNNGAGASGEAARERRSWLTRRHGDESLDSSGRGRRTFGL